MAQHETTNQEVLMVAKAYDFSHSTHKSLISCRLSAEQAMVNYKSLLHTLTCTAHHVTSSNMNGLILQIILPLFLLPWIACAIMSTM